MILTKHVRVQTEGRLGRVTLDRPDAINALTQSMIEELDFALDLLAGDAEIATVVLDGAGDRGFCAGGDVVALRDSALADGASAARFWRAEYRLNARIASFPKPVVAIMDGIVMGGGVGLAGHARHRLAIEGLAWAMPEVRIGFAPDVGGTYILSRLPGELGTWIALTARRLDARTASALGLVDQIIRREDVEGLLRRLTVEDADAVLGNGAPVLPVPGPIATATNGIDCWFAGDDAAVIERRLAEDGSAEARAALGALGEASPTAVAVTLAALRQARGLANLEECLEAELRTSVSFLGVEDFSEGIRAALVDKDRNPRWRPDSLGAVEGAVVEGILEGPADLEPLWKTGEQEGGRGWSSVR